MQDSTLLLVAGAGLALVCVGLVVVGLLALLRVIGAGSIPLLGALLGGGGDDEHRRIVRATPKPDLRSIAQSASARAAPTRAHVPTTTTMTMTCLAMCWMKNRKNRTED
jgi:hypothetical protein